MVLIYLQTCHNIFIIRKEPHTLELFVLLNLLYPQANANLLSVYRDLPVLDISYKWDLTICGLA